ncbi:MAG: response regulator transcription factor [Candidatus Competibacteraceae bacterium]|uniref:Two component transcriptional regulator, LuxR family n=1 Tax=Candidatus Contendobacter odensis Run_B_J11 TaxID=1400861 RepID=A0A7U7J491_9GAMM|nr:response regulator transcription factor [Candidatus Contendobacter odensis]MBK8533758.1 response regulator transcription factor [Candidatus Competibacteraceae bacterium]MBK8754122.1 response regulator transcription factor [Candidatus Competibacteraceae bacterium]CDH45116.1 Two component transcriptional regulator, LuxR family [Candidatus Contendobacter odensis Run_B_J11]
MNEIKVLLADDHTLVRAGLRALIEGFEGFCVVAETGDGREAVRLIRQLQPDIALIDISMPGLNGLDATALISRETPDTRVIILSMHTAETYVLEAIRAGASGYVVKDSAVDEMERALRAIQKGERWLSPSVSRHLLDEYLRLVRGQPMAGSGMEALTPRQREILQLIAEGHSTREIADRLSISVKTVETHRAQIMERLNIRDVAGLTRFALRTGLIDPER